MNKNPSQLDILELIQKNRISLEEGMLLLTGKTDNVSEDVDIQDKTKSLVVEVFNQVTDLPLQQINTKTTFDEYGIDSLIIRNLTFELEKVLGKLSKTLFFEYRNLSELTDYFIKNHRDALLNHFGCAQTQKSTSSIKTMDTVHTDDILLAELQWRSKRLNITSPEFSNKTILLFDQKKQMQNDLKKRKDIQTVIRVEPGKQFKKVEQDHYIINIKQEESYTRLFKCLADDSISPQRILHYWSALSTKPSFSLDDQLYLGFFSLFFICKACFKFQIEKSVSLVVIQENNTVNSDKSYLPFTALNAFLHTARLENQKFKYKSLEFIIDGPNQSQNRIDVILDELDNESDVEVRYIGGKRLVNAIREIELNCYEPVSEYPVFRQNGVYLITGGMGALGYIFAEYLAKEYQAKLVLIGRSTLTENKKQKIQTLKGFGAEVVYIQADISSKNEVKKTIDQIDKKFGQINGIIHSAGELRDAYLINKHHDDVKKVLSPKVVGTLNLDECIAGRPLDLFILFSSTASIKGNPGQCDYAFGNRFMDDFASWRNQLCCQKELPSRYGKTISINWPLWKDGGMQLDEKMVENLSKKGIRPLGTNQGLVLFEKVLQWEGSHIVVVKGRKNKLRALFNMTEEDKSRNEQPLMEISNTTQNRQKDDIAIIGISGRYPMAENLDEYWENLSTGKDCISRIPPDYWHDKIPYFEGEKFGQWGGFLEKTDYFDPLFFQISPKEALIMDPQERLFLETAWQTFEDAGYTRNSIGRNVGVFVGVMYGHYQLYSLEKSLRGVIPTLTSSFASIANRISYFFNFNGPSIAVDTMCSSSLTAIHLACESIKKEECHTAIAGGVNLTIHPSKYVCLSENNFASSDGRCRSFGKGGDGYVPGEGVGAVLLKPINQAVADGDNIYAVIKGGSINHGGRTNGYTVPNPLAQEKLVKQALQNAGISPNTISYIEAHGTGTSLGDPIEMRGLVGAFEEDDIYPQTCAIGSVKSNIGHLESAAGIAGVTKVALQMRYKTLVPSIHAEVLNPDIDFDVSPFYVHKELSPWESPRLNGKLMPRRAGISAFGAGGSNAHLILEEYIASSSPTVSRDEKTSYLFVLSAKSRNDLNNYVGSILRFIEDKGKSDPIKMGATSFFADFIYSLQVGREAMEERLAFVVSGLEDLKVRLSQYLEDSLKTDLFSRSKKNQNKPDNKLLMEGLEGERYLLDIFKSQKLDELAQLWINGAEINWSLLYRDGKHNRISLPTYPFDRKRYWGGEKSSEWIGSTVPAAIAPKHPLLHENISSFGELRFSSTFTGNELLFAHHEIGGQPVLPGAAHLEMAIAAITYGLDGRDNTGSSNYKLTLKDIVWARPIVFEDIGNDVTDTRIYTGLVLDERDQIHFNIYSKPNIEMSNPTIYSKGIGVVDSLNNELSGNIYDSIDITAIQTRCEKSIVTDKQCYERYRSMGINYGATYHGVKQIFLGEDQALARIDLPRMAQADKGKYQLHPAILDSALHAAIGLVWDSLDDSGPMLPFALDEFKIIAPYLSTNWAYIRYSQNNLPNSNIKKLDIDLCDDTGKIVLQFRGLTSKEQKIETDSAITEERDLAGSEACSGVSGKIDKVAKNSEYKEVFLERVIQYLKKLLSSVIKLPVNRIREDISFEKYGINSIMIMELTDQLETKFGPLSKTLFYEYKNIRLLAAYFFQSYEDELKNIVGIEKKPPSTTRIAEKTVPINETAVISQSKKKKSFFSANAMFFPNKKPSVNSNIAIIGVSGRYPQAGDIQEFWDNLVSGKDCITEIPPDRWDHNLYFDEERNKPGKAYSKWGGFIEDVDRFDPLFFNISPREAVIMDPKERLFLETVWNLLEHSGYTKQTLQRVYQSKIGVFVGAMYQQYHAFDSDIVQESAVSLSSYASIANRISFFFDFQGPSMSIDTACSSSLVSVHQACESLIRGDCRLAIAGGVNLSIHPKKYLGLSQSQIIGSYPGSRSFGNGDGYLPAEGVGAVLLKPLTKAVDEGDSILAIIKSTHINHGGHTHGFSVPSPDAQALLIEDNFNKCGIDPRTISYVESAANGSAMGDLIEMTGLNKAFRKFTQDNHFCAIGSVKSNIGHAEAASGISQLTKVVLQLIHKKLVPSIKVEPLNPNLSFDNTPFYLNQEFKDWQKPTVTVNGKTQVYPRRAAISSFGAFGSNAHLIIEEYISHPGEMVHVDSIIEPQIVVFSAKTRVELNSVVEQMAEFVAENAELSLVNFAYTLQVGREPMEHRLAMVVDSYEELIKGMKEFLNDFQENEDVERFIPLFLGDLEGKSLEINTLLSGKTGEAFVRILLEENNLNKIADYWAQGGQIQWELLHKNKIIQKMILPTYPFTKKRYWISANNINHSVSAAISTIKESEQDEPEKTTLSQKTSQLNQKQAIFSGSLKDKSIAYLKNLLRETLNIPESKINISDSWGKYGLDSILAMEIINKMKRHFSDLSKTLFFEYGSIKELTGYLTKFHKKSLTALFDEKSPSVETLNGKKDEHSLVAQEKLAVNPTDTGSIFGADILGRIDQLSPEEVDKLLHSSSNKELSGMNNIQKKQMSNMSNIHPDSADVILGKLDQLSSKEVDDLLYSVSIFGDQSLAIDQNEPADSYVTTSNHNLGQEQPMSNQLNINPDSVAEILERLDQLSPEEVDGFLHSITIEEIKGSLKSNFT